MEKGYCIVTPAFNEEAYIANTIESVVAQTMEPNCWIIVDDGSTDLSSKIVEKYLKEDKVKYVYC